jgi:hypothetical protein
MIEESTARLGCEAFRLFVAGLLPARGAATVPVTAEELLGRFLLCHPHLGRFRDELALVCAPGGPLLVSRALWDESASPPAAQAGGPPGR